MSSRNIRLLIAYDGSPYAGWQVQPDKPTVQQQIEQAIATVTQEHCRLACAGRTDTGVHAIGQVASFRTHSSIPIERFPLAIQSQLPESIIIRSAKEVPEDFHAGHSSLWKLYRYVILNDRHPRPHLRNFVTRVGDKLDVCAMDAAAQQLIGRHDFRSFESHYPNKATSVRTVHYCRVRRQPEWTVVPGRQPFSESAAAEPFVVLDIAADGFLYNMVRAITGTLLQVGIGAWQPEQVAEIVQAQDRKLAGPTALPNGLYLMHVEYERPFSVEQAESL